MHASEDFLIHLKARMAEGLPGMEGQNIMAPRTPESYRIAPPNAIPAAVLILLYPKNHNWHIALIKRKNIKGDKHAGQVSLPGGRKDKNDIDDMQCALRETEEEIGIPRENISILGQLTDFYVFASNHIVYPFIGYTLSDQAFVPEEAEVDRIIEAPLSAIMSSDNHKIKDVNIRGMTLKDVPYFDIDNEIVWGATAMILSEFVELVKQLDKHA